jgi:UDPglucose--hexose-1-phosphate uridylyltransferase
VKRTSTRLADGRELIYFDESDDAARDVIDQRDLPPPPRAPQMRYDAVLDEWVAIAAHRQTRTHLPPTDQCPLCPSAPGRDTEIPASSYDVVVFENRFPSFSQRVDPEPEPTPDRRPAIGRCEVVCFTADHTSSFGSLPPERVRTVVEAWADRTAELSELPGVEQVFCFENRGEEIGVTLHHPHGQIYAYPFVTPRTQQMLRSARAYAAAHGDTNVFAARLAAERESGERVVATNADWTAFVPAAARWPYEIHLYPHRQVPDIAALSGAERDSFAELYPQVLRQLDALFGVPMPYIAAWYQAPVRVDRDLSYLHLQVSSSRRAPGKLKFLAGSEAAMGAFINDVRPEDAARQLRDAAI